VKYAGFKKGMAVHLTFKDKNGETWWDDGIITHSSGQRIVVKCEGDEYWHFTRHGACQEVPSWFEEIEMTLK
jgi:hypothetical protein